MEQGSWAQLIAAALGGGFVVKMLDIAYLEFRAWKERTRVDRLSVDDRIEPLLKATNELAGKLRSLAQQDFIPIRRVEGEWIEDTDVSGTIFLFVQFWAHVEILRSSHLNGILGRSQRGKQLTAFLNCLESRRMRLIDRIAQRAIGEAAVINGCPMNYVEFMRSLSGTELGLHGDMPRWIAPLESALKLADATKERQILLQNLVVLHALVDTIDPDHSVTDNRPGLPNKLNTGSWRDLNFRVFDVYLQFVGNRTKYIGPPKGRP